MFYFSHSFPYSDFIKSIDLDQDLRELYRQLQVFMYRHVQRFNVLTVSNK